MTMLLKRENFTTSEKAKIIQEGEQNPTVTK
jgi:hypothetical protein